MRKYTDTFGNIIDLNNPKIYKYLPDDYNTLVNLMWKEIGYCLCYMKYYKPKVFENSEQKERVEKLIKRFCKNNKKHFNDIKWYKEQIYLLQDEIENMC